MLNILRPNLYVDDIHCKNCHNEENMRYDHVNGNILCISCGNIAQKKFIDFTAEYRIFSDDNGNGGSDPNRVGGIYNENLEDGGLGTFLHFTGERNNSHLFTNQINYKHFEGVKKIKDWGFALGLENKIVKYAISNFEKFSNTKRSVFKNSDELLAAILFLSARSENSFLDLNELSNICGKEKKDIKRCFWLIKKCGFKSKNLDKTCMKPSYYAKLFADKLNLPPILTEKIKKIGEKIEEVGILDGKNPKNVASVIIYNETNCTEETKKTFKEIALISDISDQTIKTTYEILLTKLGSLDLHFNEKTSLEDILKELGKLKV